MLGTSFEALQSHTHHAEQLIMDLQVELCKMFRSTLIESI